MKIWNRLWPVFLVLASLLSACLPPRASTYAEANWYTDINKAAAEAQQKNRPLFIAFLGGDWSAPSAGVEKDLLNTQEFKDFADDNLVLLKIDFSRTGLNADTLQSYANLAKSLQVDRFPIFILADPSNGTGVFQRINGYGGGGVQEFTGQLTAILQAYREQLPQRIALLQAQRAAASSPQMPSQPTTMPGGYPSPQQLLSTPPEAPAGAAPGAASGSAAPLLQLN